MQSVLKLSLDEAFKIISDAVSERLDELLPPIDQSLEAKIFDAMRYSSMSGGKRLRPFLTYITAMMFNVSHDSAINTACAIEMIHTYSLIHDDLPAMDDDTVRRGKPTCHIMFDEATAILAGDALLTYAFEILASEKAHPDTAVRCELISRVASSSGHSGMVGGQMIDMEAQNLELSISEITRLQRMKTGELFAVACEAGTILGKASKNIKNAIRSYAISVGLAYQIIDDLLDIIGDDKIVGKTLRKDSSQNKATIVSILGAEAAYNQAKLLTEQAIHHLSVFDEEARLLRELAVFINDRSL
ncbi:MAG: polyprenyl synthetase family protein [Alphaproteobacteria bacterium]|nr:polyprenyl synthetase family protein [Alphaproteobacteria bacterium]OJV13491.1 MAG: farnesyl-diphosphate synthase [Alphaproteobacteria bacterium 33-17]